MNNLDNSLKSFFNISLFFSNINGALFQSSSGSSGSSIRGEQLTKLNPGFPNDRPAANGDHHQQPNEELHLRVMELSAR